MAAGEPHRQQGVLAEELLELGPQLLGDALAATGALDGWVAWSAAVVVGAAGALERPAESEVQATAPVRTTMTRATSPVRERMMPSSRLRPGRRSGWDAASVAAVSLFGREPKFGILWAAGRGCTARRRVGWRDRGLGLVGLLAARLGGGRSLIGTTWSRCVANRSRRVRRQRRSAGVVAVARVVGLPVAIRDPRPGRYGRTRKLMSSTQPAHLRWICRTFGFCGCAKFGAGRRAVYGPVRHSSRLSGGDLALYCEGKHERSKRWCCTTAVLVLFAVPVLVVATGIPGARFHRPVRLDMDPCTPGKFSTS